MGDSSMKLDPCSETGDDSGQGGSVMSTTATSIKPETVERLAVIAAAKGFDSIDEFVEQSFPDLSPEIGQTEERPLYETATPEEWAKAFSDWANSHDATIPPLTLEDISRESIYEDRW
jgi:hypothetical protein